MFVVLDTLQSTHRGKGQYPTTYKRQLIRFNLCKQESNNCLIKEMSLENSQAIKWRRPKRLTPQKGTRSGGESKK